MVVIVIVVRLDSTRVQSNRIDARSPQKIRPTDRTNAHKKRISRRQSAASSRAVSRRVIERSRLEPRGTPFYEPPSLIASASAAHDDAGGVRRAEVRAVRCVCARVCSCVRLCVARLDDDDDDDDDDGAVGDARRERRERRERRRERRVASVVAVVGGRRSRAANDIIRTGGKPGCGARAFECLSSD